MKDEALRLAIESLCCVRDMVGHPDNLEYIDHQVAKIEAELEAKNEPMEFFDWYDNAHWGNEDFKEGCHRSWNAAIKYTAKPNQEAKDEPSCKECEIAYCSAKGKNFDICSQYVPPKDKRQQALERKAENARELGLDYEPEQPKVRTGDCLLVGVCASEGHKIAPQRTWVGLTDNERSKIWGELPQTLNEERDACIFAEAIELYLKERNK